MQVRLVFLLPIVISTILCADSVSLQEIFSYASKNALSLKIKKSDALIELNNVKSAKANYYPSLNLVYNNEYTESLDGIPLGTETIGGITISNGTRYQNSAALQLNYNLYHFGVTDKQVAIATLKADVKNKELCQQEKKLHQKILELYADTLKQLNEKKYRTAMLSIRKKLYTMKERLYKAGQYSKVDLGDEAIYLISIERDIENSYMQYKDDIIKLSQLSYMEIQEDTQLLPIKFLHDTQEVHKFEESIEAKIIERKIVQKEEEIALQLKEQLPSVGLYSNYYLYSSNPKKYDYPITHLRKKSWNIGFSVRFNIFEGFKNSANAQRLHLEMQQLQLEYNQSRHNFIYDLQAENIKIDELSILQTKEEHLLKENKKKLEMILRLRKNQKVDKLTQLNSEYALQEHTLNLRKRKIDAAKEHLSLQIINRGIQECTQH